MSKNHQIVTVYACVLVALVYKTQPRNWTKILRKSPNSMYKTHPQSWYKSIEKKPL